MKEQEISAKELRKLLSLGAITLNTYLKKGLIPRPRMESNYKGKVGRSAVYPYSVIDRIKKIRELVSEGYTLEAIRKTFESEIDKGKEKELKKEIREAIMETIEIDNPLTLREMENIVWGLHLGWGTAIPPDEERVKHFKDLLRDSRREKG